MVDQAPPLTPAQRDRLAVLLNPHPDEDPEIARRTAAAESAKTAAAIRKGKEAAAARERAAAAAEAARKRCALYRHWDTAGVLLYVGISVDTSKRRAAHLRQARWVRFHDSETVEWLPDRSAAELAERTAIENENPIFNLTYAAAGATERRLRYLVAREAWDLLAEVKS